MPEYDLEHPQSRGEQYLATMTHDYSGDLPEEPHSRVEAYLEKLVDLTEDTEERISDLETGKADLVDGKVPSEQLPSYVDDVQEYMSYAYFPEVGEKGKIYVALDTNDSYRWSGMTYIKIANPTEFDTVPTEGSTNGITSGGAFEALSKKQGKLTFDDAPTENSNNPVKSGGIFDALNDKQDKLTFDNVPVENSGNPVKSGGVFSELATLKALGFSIDSDGYLVQEADD